MPIYEYECRGCGKPFELLIRSSDEEDRKRCPHCGSGKADRRLSVFAARGEAAGPAPASGCGRCGDPQGPCGRG